ncbi:MAG: hypothetical protein IKW12_02605 [Clostridia bacterium]|nr:hypothetical protein [Clostridia bacterium]
MKKFIQKTTSIFMSLAMVALIGAPAYAATAEDETEQLKPEIIESVLPDIASAKSTLAVDFAKEEAIETELPPEVCDHGEEEFAGETEDSDAEENEEEFVATPTDPVGTQTPEISTEDIFDYIQSEEVQDVLEDAGVDFEEVEEEIENGNYEIIYITQEEFEQMRKDSALGVMKTYLSGFGQSLLILLMIPAAPIMFFVPFVGPLATGVILASPLFALGMLGIAILSPVLAYGEYKNFELDPGYEIVDEK